MHIVYHILHTIEYSGFVLDPTHMFELLQNSHSHVKGKNDILEHQIYMCMNSYKMNTWWMCMF